MKLSLGDEPGELLQRFLLGLNRPCNSSVQSPNGERQAILESDGETCASLLILNHDDVELMLGVPPGIYPSVLRGLRRRFLFDRLTDPIFVVAFQNASYSSLGMVRA